MIMIWSCFLSSKKNYCRFIYWHLHHVCYYNEPWHWDKNSEIKT